MFTDRELTCCDCGESFVFTAGEQEFYQSKGFSSDPKRCPKCRKNRNSRGTDTRRAMFEVTCADCGQLTQVPFRPRGDRPVYCNDCFKKRNGEH